MHVLVTGHTGFKGAWLISMLRAAGHEVSGLALGPATGSLFERSGLADLLVHDVRADIRDATAVEAALRTIAPDAVLHLAAQALVRFSYREPRLTYETNVLGTLNVLEAVREQPSVRAQVVITTDKVYRNVDQIWGYRETDALGGHDPYSASKAAADIVTQSWIASSGAVAQTAIARAGNVVGGGDTAEDRLMVDLIGAYRRGERPKLRFPDAVRPWQHVLDCLNGYLFLLDALVTGRFAGEAFNFGPGTDSFVTVGDVATRVAELWGAGQGWELVASAQPYEAGLLALDARKAELRLGWRNLLDFEDTLAWTVEWEQQVDRGVAPLDATMSQVERFAGRGDLPWRN